MHNHIKYPEILIGEVLSWNKHTESICMNLAGANGILTKLSHSVSKDIYISIYYFVFYTHLICGCLDWSYSTKSNIDRVIKLQKMYIWIINFSDFNSDAAALFFELKLMKVNNISSLKKLLLYIGFLKGKPSRRTEKIIYL